MPFDDSQLQREVWNRMDKSEDAMTGDDEGRKQEGPLKGRVAVEGMLRCLSESREAKREASKASDDSVRAQA